MSMIEHRLLRKDIKEAEKVVCGQNMTVTEKNTVVTRVCYKLSVSASTLW
jgi:hypothetical protein